ncbi:MAG: T9SS type A sorting domain-containing protein [Ignavibacteria bacterium]
MHTVILKKPRYVVYLILLISLFSNSFIYSQVNYVMSIDNGRYINNNTFEFDIYINSNTEPFELTSYQCVLSFNKNLAKDGTLRFIYVDGSSDLSNFPVSSIGINSTDNFKELTFASMPGSDNISKDSKKVGTFQLESSNSFDINKAEISWNFDGMIGTILTGSQYENITQPSNHKGSFITGLEIQTEVKDYSLNQNYPNPFNPSTMIRFSLKDNGKVRLAVYNLLGEQVSELVNKEMIKGIHEVEFNAANLASGVYIYKLDIENKFSSVRKMILAK